MPALRSVLASTALSSHSNPRSAAEHTMAAMKQYIMDNHLQPGDPLPTEATMCDVLGVSRSSVREAIRTLAALDIVHVRHGHGMFVGEISMDPMVEQLVFRAALNPGEDRRALKDIVQIRRALDLAAGEDIVHAWQGRDVSSLTTYVSAMAEQLRAGNSITAHDIAFHRELLTPLDNKLLGQLTTAFWEVHTRLTPRMGIPTPTDLDQTVHAHQAMADAATSGDLHAYHQAVRDHYAPLLRIIDSSTSA
ncbi:FadR/GntR family transcriptional regulator [Actinomyces vulturis]|uniref:FadR/GntR family transcriptional regulator n=1 Tax=Actinomyces vulturis TaxID=1857645 RepID=UPI000832A93F|nr:GntR family transcriptional regulator [Actinomyces vulturis]